MSDKKTRIHHAIVKAQEAFWAEIAKAFPEAQSGDMSPETQCDFDAACASAVEDWVDANVSPETERTDVPTQ